MPLAPYRLLFASGTCSAIASILLRISGQTAMPVIGVITLATALRATALAAYGAGFLFYAMALKRIELNIAYPLMVGITMLEIFVFGFVSGEAASLKTMAGATFLAAGIYLLYSA
jgi:small multidrug resistance pump